MQNTLLDEAEKADAIIVLGAAVLRGGQPSPALRRRLSHGVALWRAGLAPRLLLSGGVVREPPAEATVMAELARADGVPDAALVIEGLSRNTLENGREIKALFDRHGWRRAILVTDHYHMGRARLVFRMLGIAVVPSPAPSPGWTVWLGPQLRELAARPVYWWRLRRELRELVSG